MKRERIEKKTNNKNIEKLVNIDFCNNTNKGCKKCEKLVKEIEF